MITIRFLARLSLVVGLAKASPQWGGGHDTSRHEDGLPTCTDGGQLRCCGAVFNGDNAPTELLTSLSCYDLTPATTNCLLTATSPDSDGSCPGYWQCCQIVLDPIIGIYCGPPPGRGYTQRYSMR
ncbi:hypothetical protein DOTSEDRAFT_71428 [Dothistroma septosporum NZE10]|uniref:Hydrophobin n=1 Tax=Dothistroma septosporum (strain NZE10 / CBS 128990) TaxID=675120 RepID=N1PS10_DOTSN|nr:hypothetical protein DOTSEDRAFT_71428 [Dothistroma septosporum NZE10]